MLKCLMLVFSMTFMASLEAMISSFEEPEDFPPFARPQKRKAETIEEEKLPILKIRIEYCKNNFKEIAPPHSDTPFRSCLVYDISQHEEVIFYGFCVQDKSPQLDLNERVTKHLKHREGTLYQFETEGQIKIKNGNLRFPLLINISQLKQNVNVYFGSENDVESEHPN